MFMKLDLLEFANAASVDRCIHTAGMQLLLDGMHIHEAWRGTDTLHFVQVQKKFS